MVIMQMATRMASLHSRKLDSTTEKRLKREGRRGGGLSLDGRGGAGVVGWCYNNCFVGCNPNSRHELGSSQVIQPNRPRLVSRPKAERVGQMERWDRISPCLLGALPSGKQGLVDCCVRIR